MYRQQLGLALFSATLLLTEIALTRFYAVRYYPPVVFAILSLALLGIGLGAAIAAWRPSARRRERTALYAAAMACAVTGQMLVVALWAEPPSEMLGWTLALLAFVLSGLAIATLYSAGSEASPTLYWADLTGAGIGALLAAPLLSALGVINILLASSLAAALAALLLRSTKAATAEEAAAETKHAEDVATGIDTILPIAATTIIALLLASNLALDWITVDLQRLPTEKPIGERLAAGGRIVATRLGWLCAYRPG